MTTVNEAKSILNTAFLTAWNDATPVQLPNEVYKPVKGTSWVRVSYQELPSSGQETLGTTNNRKFQRNSLMFFEVSTPLNEGSKPSDDLVQDIRTFFEAKSFSGVKTFDLIIRDQNEEADWYRVVLEGLFSYNEVK